MFVQYCPTSVSHFFRWTSAPDGWVHEESTGYVNLWRGWWSGPSPFLSTMKYKGLRAISGPLHSCATTASFRLQCFPPAPLRHVALQPLDDELCRIFPDLVPDERQDVGGRRRQLFLDCWLANPRELGKDRPLHAPSAFARGRGERIEASVGGFVAHVAVRRGVAVPGRRLLAIHAQSETASPWRYRKGLRRS